MEYGTSLRKLEAGHSTPCTLSSREADIQDLVPVSRPEFIVEVGPCLALASGVGMSNADQQVWLEAAYKALAGIPIALLKRGAAAAMARADHPSKIVPAIIAEVRESWEWRKRNQAAPRYQPALPKPIETAEEKAEREEVAAMMARLAKRLEANAA
jgi:hypothetical protein